MEESQTTLHGDAKNIAAEFKDYAFSVSHGLNTSARAMAEFSELHISGHAENLDDEGKECPSLIIEHYQKMQAMMAELLHYSRLNIMAKPFTEADVGRIVQDVLIVLKPQDSASKAVIEVEKLPAIVANNGIGILPQYSGKMFNLFACLYTEGEYPGEGIGLALAEKILRRHGEEIWHNKTPQNGSEFPLALKTRSRSQLVHFRTMGCVDNIFIHPIGDL